MKTRIEKFSDERIQKIKMNLEQNIESGNPKFYEIHVDDIKWVNKTNDISQFDNYEIYVTDKSEEIKILLYQGVSFRYDTFIFELPAKTKIQSNELQGVPYTVEERIQQALRENELQNLKRDFEKLESELEESKEYIEVLEDRIAGLETEKDAKGKFWELAGALLAKGNEMVKRNPSLLKKVPIVGETLAGDLELQQMEEQMYMQQQMQLAKSLQPQFNQQVNNPNLESETD